MYCGSGTKQQKDGVMDNDIEEPLPDWAKGSADGDYELLKACLPTRDGRRTGNAIVACKLINGFTDDPLYLCITDAGNPIRATLNEMKELWYPPEYVAKFFLPTHLNVLKGHDHDRYNCGFEDSPTIVRASEEPEPSVGITGSE